MRPRGGCQVNGKARPGQGVKPIRGCARAAPRFVVHPLATEEQPETMALAAPSSLRRLPATPPQARSPPAFSRLRSRPLREPRLRLRQPLVAAAAATAPLSASASPVRTPPRAPPPLAKFPRHSLTRSGLAGGNGAEEARAAARGSGNAARIRGGARPARRHRGGRRTYEAAYSRVILHSRVVAPFVKQRRASI